MSQANPSSTAVNNVDMSFIDEMFAPSASDVVTNTEAKPNIFSSKGVDTSFLDEPPAKPAAAKPEDANTDEDAEDPNKEPEAGKETPTQAEIDDILNITTDNEEPGDGTEPAKGGRPKTDKSALQKTIKKLIESNHIVPFDDEKPLEEYTEKDYEELIIANFEDRERRLKEATPQEFFNSLPSELQHAAKYVADGGTDLKGLFRALSHVEEVKALDPSNESDQMQICRNYLKATNYGDDAEIEDEIATWKDLGRLETKANTFKPKLDKMSEDIVKQQLQQQEQAKQQQAKATQDYVTNVFTALKTGEINGLKLDKNTQAALYAGLTQPNYQSVSGKKTNMLGHLLEKYQFVEPNQALVCEALWLLSNPDAYRAEIRKQGKNDATTETVRKLKDAQASKKPTGSGMNDDEDNKTPTRQPGQKALQRNKNIFARPN